MDAREGTGRPADMAEALRMNPDGGCEGIMPTEHFPKKGICR